VKGAEGIHSQLGMSILGPEWAPDRSKNSCEEKHRTKCSLLPSTELWLRGKPLSIVMLIFTTNTTIHHLFNWLTLWSWVLLQETLTPSDYHGTSDFYAARRFITGIIGACHWSLSWARWNLSCFFNMCFHVIIQSLGACGSVVGWDTMLQAERSRVDSRWGHWIFHLT
jgi:hypothetical protein